MDGMLSDTRQPLCEQPYPHFNIPYDRGDKPGSSSSDDDDDDDDDDSDGSGPSSQPLGSDSDDPGGQTPPPASSPTSRPSSPSTSAGANQPNSTGPGTSTPVSGPGTSTRVSPGSFFGLPSTSSCRAGRRRTSLNLNLNDSFNDLTISFKIVRFYNRYPNNKQAFFCWAVGKQ